MEQSILDLILNSTEVKELDKSCPHNFHLKKGKKELFYFGCDHIYDPGHPQFNQVKEEFLKLDPQLALWEGGGKNGDLSSEESAKKWGEATYLIWLAHQKGVEESTLDAPKEEDIKFQLQHFPKELVYTFYCVRPLGTLKRRNPSATVEEVKQNLNNSIKYLKNIIPFDDFDYSIENLQTLFQEITGHPLSLDVLTWKGNYTGPVSFDSKLDDLWDSSLKYRDIYAVETIIKALEKYDRVFALMGSLHAYAQEPALRKWFEVI